MLLSPATFDQDLGAPLARAIYALVNNKIQGDNENRAADRDMQRWQWNADQQQADRSHQRALQTVDLAHKTGIVPEIQGADRTVLPAAEAAAGNFTYEQTRRREREALADAIARLGGIEAGATQPDYENPVEVERASLGADTRTANLENLRAMAEWRRNYGKGSRTTPTGVKFNDARGEAHKRAMLAAGLAKEEDLSFDLHPVTGDKIPLPPQEKARRIKSVQDAYGRELARMGYGLDGQPIPVDRMPQATEDDAISGGTRGFDDNGNPTADIPAGPDLSDALRQMNAAPAAPEQGGLWSALKSMLFAKDSEGAKSVAFTTNPGGLPAANAASAPRAPAQAAGPVQMSDKDLADWTTALSTRGGPGYPEAITKLKAWRSGKASDGSPLPEGPAMAARILASLGQPQGN